MVRHWSLSWSSYFWCGALALILSWAVTGCRWGNKIQEATKPKTPSDSFSGYFANPVNTVAFCVQTKTASDPSCMIGDNNLLPQPFKNVLSDPLKVVLKDASGLTYLLNPFGDNVALGVILNFNDGSFAHDPASSIAEGTLWKDPACLQRNEINVNGFLSKKNEGVQSKGLTLSGSMYIDLIDYNYFVGPCTDSLTAISQCYQDFTKCERNTEAENKSEQAYWVTLFDPYIQSKAMNTGDIINLQAIAFEAIFK